MKTLAKEAVGQIRRCMLMSQRLPNPEEVTFVYENTVEWNPLMDLLIEKMVVSYLSAGSSGVANIDMRWVKAVIANSDFHCAVMDALKDHTLLKECNLRKCSVHDDRNGVRERRLIRQRGRGRGKKSRAKRHLYR